MAGITEYFCKHSGEDWWIIDHCGHRGIRGRFALVGLVAFLVGALSFLSCWYSFQMLFDSAWMAIPVSLLFAWMINNIYEVLLTTLSKPVLRMKYQGVIKHLSIILRVGFVVFFAVFISKPLEAWVFEPQLSSKVEQLKARQIGKAENELMVQSAKVEQRLLAAIRHKEHLGYPVRDIQPLRDELDRVVTDRENALERVRFVIGRADFFVQRLQLLVSGGIYMLSWFFTVMVVVLFLLPFYLKWHMDISNPYFKDKRTVYEDIILQDYREFKRNYTDLFRDQYQLDIQVGEIYQDAPFNTEKITDKRSFKGQEDFLEWVYP
jgi:putative flippase GtrA